MTAGAEHSPRPDRIHVLSSCYCRRY